ncbi:MAG TPA: hypothetical protein VKY41_10245 [Xanthomarina sp.]|nr:hypothetical protein [Xanthomarina sp.]
MLVLVLTLCYCSSDDSSNHTSTPTPELQVTGTILPFGDTDVLSFSDSQFVAIMG